MSDVVVSVTESTTAVTVTEQAVAVAVTESPTVVSTSVAGLQGATGATGATGPQGSQGTAGASGVVSVISPITNTGTSSSAIVGINQTLLSLTRSQISDFTSGTVAVSGTATYATTSGTAVTISGSITKSQVSDFTSGTVAQATNASTATYATTSGTASYATTSGTSVSISGSITKSQVSDFTSGTVASAIVSGTATYATTSGTAVYATTSGTAVYATSAGTVTGAAYTNASNIFTLGQIVQTGSAANTGLVVKGTTSQTGNLQEWQNTGATVIAQVTSGGSFYANGNLGAGGTAISTARLSVSGAASGIGVIVRANATTPGDIQQWQSSASAVLTSVNSLGAHVFASGSTAVGGAPVYFGTATPALLTSAVQGANEYDGLAFYKTPSVSATTGRAVDVATHYYASTGYTFDFTTSATGQSILDGGTKGITLLAGSSYEVEYQVSLTQAYFGDSRNFTAGYATTTVSGSPVTSFNHILDYGSNTTSAITATTLQSYGFAVSNTLVVSASIATGSRYTFYRAKGIVRVTGTGSVKFYPTLTPSATVPNNSIATNSGTYFKITPIGNGTVTQVGAFA